MHIVARCNDISIAEVLLHHKAEVDVQSYVRQQRRTRFLFSTFLLCSLTFPDPPFPPPPKKKPTTQAGITPLHRACSHNAPAIVKLLLDFGASPTITNMVNSRWRQKKSEFVPSDLMKMVVPFPSTSRKHKDLCRKFFDFILLFALYSAVWVECAAFRCMFRRPRCPFGSHRRGSGSSGPVTKNIRALFW